MTAFEPTPGMDVLGEGAVSSTTGSGISRCSEVVRKGTVPSTAPIAGALCSFEHPRRCGEAELLWLASRQHGCVHRWQLNAAGFGRKAIRNRVGDGRLRAVYRNVFVLGGRPSDWFSMAMAAALRHRGDAAIGGRAAAKIWGFDISERGGVATEAPIEVVLSGRRAHPARGLIVRTSAAIRADQVRWRNGLPVTAPSQTLVDLASRLGAVELQAAIMDAKRRRLVRDAEIRAAIETASANTKGLGTVRRLIAQADSLADTRSSYERKLMQLVRLSGLPLPEFNVLVGGHMVDLYWRDLKLVVEVDGYWFHSDRRAFERDRARGQDLAATGNTTLRITARQIDDEPVAVIARLAAAVALRQ